MKKFTRRATAASFTLCSSIAFGKPVQPMLASDSKTANYAVLKSDPRYANASNHLEKIVRNSLKDAPSAIFGETIVCVFSPQHKYGIVRVNAKNSFGGYSGFQTFIPVETPGLTRTLTVRTNPRGAEQFDEQRAVLMLLDACEPMISAYDAERKAAK